MRPEGGQSAIARQQGVTRPDMATSGAQHHPSALVQGQRGGFFVDLHAQRQRGTGQAQSILQGMHMAGAVFIGASHVARAVNHGAHLRAVGTRSGQAVGLVHKVHFGIERARLARAVGHIQIAIFTLASYAPLGNARIHQVNGL